MIARHGGLYALAIALAVSASAATKEIVLHAGDADRHDAIVEFHASDLKEGKYSLVGEGDQRHPLQVDASGRAVFIEPHLPTGKSKRYRIETQEKAASELTLTKRDDTLKFALGDKPILTYQMQPGPVPAGVEEQFRHGAHLHPVFSPSGKVVTGNHPADHKWHRGIWFAWTNTEFEGRKPDFWNMAKEKDGRFTGEVRFDRLERTWSGPIEAGFVGRHRFIDHTSGAEKDALHETWEVRVFRPVTGKIPAIIFDLTSTQTCASGVPLKLPKYHYGGLGVRGSGQWDPVDKVTMLTSSGDDRKKGDGTKAKWVYLGGEVDGAPAGTTILIHPGNFRFPQPLRLNPKNPQLSIAPSADGEWEIAPGKPYVSRYRFVITDGNPDPAVIDRLWTNYATPPRVEVQ